MVLDQDSIFKKVYAFSKSDSGKRKMSEYIKQCEKNGLPETASGAKIINEKEMHNAAIVLAQSIISAASMFDLPESVMSNIRSISSTKPYFGQDKKYHIDLFFTDDLSRDSLYSDMYDGIVNIIALFNNGYLAQDLVYGFWDGHHDITGNNILRTNPGSNFTYTVSKISRPALQFMQYAISEFNSNYGKKNNITVELGDIYNEIPTVSYV